MELGDRVDQFVLGATDVYWMGCLTLMFTSAEGDTQEVEDVGWVNLAVSADRSVFATVGQSRGPTDEYGTHVLQLAAFDTRTGEQLYRTPDEEPGDGDLTDLYEEIMPLLYGVSNERIFFDRTTINLDDGSTVPASQDADFVEVYEGDVETLFPDGYHVSIRGEGRRRELGEYSVFGAGRLSPDRSTIFDMSTWPTEAVVYDAKTGRNARSMPRGSTSPWAGGATRTRSSVSRRASRNRTSTTWGAARKAGRHLRVADPRVHAGEPGDPDRGRWPFSGPHAGGQLRGGARPPEQPGAQPST